MIGYLEGKVQYVSEKTLILHVSGVGYEMLPSRAVLEKATLVGNEVSVYIHTHVREDQLSLFAFKDMRERELFRLLISVSGIGPKSAMETLTLPYTELIQAIASSDAQVLTQIQGIGKKTAERIVIELRDKISLEDLPTDMPVEPTRVSRSDSLHTIRLEQNYKDIIDALLGLGYDRKDALIVLSRYVEEHAQGEHAEEDVLKYCLQYI